MALKVYNIWNRQIKTIKEVILLFLLGRFAFIFQYYFMKNIFKSYSIFQSK